AIRSAIERAGEKGPISRKEAEALEEQIAQAGARYARGNLDSKDMADAAFGRRVAAELEHTKRIGDLKPKTVDAVLKDHSAAQRSGESRRIADSPTMGGRGGLNRGDLLMMGPRTRDERGSLDRFADVVSGKAPAKPGRDLGDLGDLDVPDGLKGLQ